MLNYTITIYSIYAFTFTMLIWNTIEVGRNDATNVVNAVFGARVLRRKMAARIAGVAVIFGALASSPVMETVRKGIFDPTQISAELAMAVYLSVYLTNTVLLYSFSTFGMPVSTTATLIFSLVGAAYAMGGSQIIHWQATGTDLLAIVLSILISGTVCFGIQRIFRTIIGPHADDPTVVRKHGFWTAGIMITGLVYFLLMQGMKNISLVQHLRQATLGQYGLFPVLFGLWFICSGLFWLLLRATKDSVARNLFGGLAVLGIISLAFAFGQNDLANCASPGVGAYMVLQHGELHVDDKVSVPVLLLLSCGLLLAIGMGTSTAQRVTRAEVNTGSQGDIVRLYAPRWCVALGQIILRHHHHHVPLAPDAEIAPNKKIQHYDALRAAVITSVSASVIAFASGRGLPVSTTYVAFAAVIATGWADRIFERGDAHLKLGRTIWVVFCWFASGLLAALVTYMGAWLIYSLGLIGLLVGLLVNLYLRFYMKKRSDAQEARMQQEATERKKILFQQKFQTFPISRFASEEDEER